MEFIGYVNETPSLVDGVLCFENGDYRMMDKAVDYLCNRHSGIISKMWISIGKHFSERRTAPIAPKS